MTSDQPSTDETLGKSLAHHQLDLPDLQRRQIARYCELLWQWNEKLNLTRHLDYETFVARDLVDSLQLAELLKPGESVLDVGTGGGVPGVLLAILRPDVRVAMCESVAKKARAVQSIVEQLELAAPVHAGRAEDLLGERSFDTLVARAVGSLSKVLKWFAPHWNHIGRLLLVKGPRWFEERNEARHRGLLKPLELRVASKYLMPGTESEGVILTIWQEGKTSCQDLDTDK